VEFVIGKKRVELIRERVEEVSEKLDPEPFKGKTKYYVEFRGEVSNKAGPIGSHWPPKGLLHHNARLQSVKGALRSRSSRVAVDDEVPLLRT
jgi:hypothetical protein